ncbi:MAG TPA: MSMEG_1061 family FMN-dependent PPOX-type flavoprotein [Baekduia sp.]|uniref:MSMEG_1061 family FMN-dependent PPOX-type flavoprotein n=1 Tax=Baekduia sp. TaxID=2600305 RepID=UPI002CCC645E|nr:MSMEG_1061 family FMN-dependent PPOX-type flavoprotein [Baekduia sp.]HMJ36653.1 MSMEG_1061 family FMN-dependent PPOX-type flavoprotein [Baekduia sp.]
MDDPFAGALTSPDQLGEHYAPATERAWSKDVGVLDGAARALIAASPLCVIGSHDAGGRADVTPRGGPAGFVAVLDDDHLAIPDATGNRRLDTLTNIIATSRAGLLFLIPGRDQTLRVNGRACVTADPAILGAAGAVGRPPRTAIVVRADEVYAHCPKAFIRSRLWDPTTWPDLATVPSPAEVMLAHLRDPQRTLAEEEEYLAEALRSRLA